MKIVSFKVAKAIKEAGYPLQRFHTVSREQFEHGWGQGIYGESPSILYPEDNDFVDMYFCPTYIDVWLWLWKEKEIYIQVERKYCMLSFPHYDSCTFSLDSSPEESIITAIEWLVDNDYIK